jgi:hypothetical protein
MPAFFNAITPQASEVPFVTSNLIGYWDALPAFQGSPWVDMAPTYNPTGTVNHDMTLANGAAFTTVGGIDALYVDGVNDYAVSANSSVITNNNYYIPNLRDFTLEIWYRTNGAYTSNGNIYTAGFNLGSRGRFDSSGNSWFYNAGMLTGGNLGGTWATNTWLHYCVTMRNINTSNDEFIVYKNAVQVGSDTTGNYNPTQNSSHFAIGTYNFGASEYFRGYYAIVRRYNRALTSTEVTQNFNAEKARFGY